VSGRVCLVGAGPGDPELLTVRAARLLSEADAVLHDRLISPEILALVRPDAEVINVGKEEGQQESVQPRIHQLLEDCARRYALVVRLKSGDPFVFGRGAEEWAWLAARGIAVEIVPASAPRLRWPRCRASRRRAADSLPASPWSPATGLRTKPVSGGAMRAWTR
jgi:siroheme synthase